MSERNSVQEREVAWYRRYGKHPERIRLTNTGEPYVIGDWSWRRSHPVAPEEVEARMSRAGVYRGPSRRECNTCHAVKPPSAFYALKGGRRTGDCKECRKARAMKWQRENRERRAQTRKKDLRLVS